ncbi:hypothetical protein ACGF4C_24240 [Streptomyces sp. NPDC048197]|uniref:hypothetical protein n=1 Tax=Streptomyces sp. NPDC048197 TaxID=3365511 RepID=UPI0037246DC9
MRAKGITYDTCFTPGGKSSRPVFDAGAVRREIRMIADDLHCDAVRITGDDPGRLALAARHAADAGLKVWFNVGTDRLDALRHRQCRRLRRCQ